MTAGVRHAGHLRKTGGGTQGFSVGDGQRVDITTVKDPRAFGAKVDPKARFSGWTDHQAVPFEPLSKTSLGLMLRPTELRLFVKAPTERTHLL